MIRILEQVFWEEDVHLIRAIPVHVEMEDTVGWHFDSKGRFSVKSADKVHGMMKSMSSPRMGAGARGSDGDSGFRSKLWKLDCPPKVKHFLWRLCHNS